MEKTQKSKTLFIRNDISELNRLVAFLEKLEEEWDLPPSVIPPVNLALEEALSNVIFYAFEKDTEHEIRLNFERKDAAMVVVVTDEGKPYDPTQKEDPDLHLPVEERPIGGLGIFLIRQVMNEVTYNRIGNKNQLTMVKTWNA